MKQNVLMIILTTIILAVVGYGKYVEKSVMDSATTIYEDRLVPQTQLSNRFDYYGTCIKDNFSSDITNVENLVKNTNDILKQREETDSIWKAYKATFLTVEEDSLVKITQVVMDSTDAYTDMLLSKAVTDPKLVDKLVKTGELKRRVKEVLNNLNSLIELQTRVGKEETEKLHNTLDQFGNFMIGILSLAIIMLGSIIYPMIQNRKQPTKPTKKPTTKKPTTKKKSPTKKPSIRK
jgi:flagellin-specific chaperone FliS